MALRVDGKDGVKSQVQEAGRFGLPAFNSHSAKRTRRYEDFSAGIRAVQRATRRILFIEDDRVIAEMYRIKLEAEGWNVEIAYDGEDGLRRAVADPPSLLLLDLLLPRMDGIEVLRHMRSEEETREVPVLILSNALGLSGREEEARALGIVDWVVKANTTPAGLAGRVARILAD